MKNYIDISLILLSAGFSRRFKSPVKKHWIRSGNIPIWLMVIDSFYKKFNFKQIFLVSSKEDIKIMKNYTDKVIFIQGGDTREESLKNALKNISTKYVLVSDIARCCLDIEMIERVIDNRKENSCVVPFLPISDTVYYKDNPIDRDKIKIIQTPQISDKNILDKALSLSNNFTDESSAIKNIEGKIIFVNGSDISNKLTIIQDLKKMTCIKEPSKNNFIGFGVDIHKFEKNKQMFLGGVEIKNISYGFKAHSDGDVLIHSLIDALLGAAGLGDIGDFYPDTSSKYKNISSNILLKDTYLMISRFGFEIINIDLTIIAEVPKISPYKFEIRKNLSKILNLSANFINIKATTSEELGFVGKKEGVIVKTIANLQYYNWKKDI